MWKIFYLLYGIIQIVYFVYIYINVYTQYLFSKIKPHLSHISLKTYFSRSHLETFLPLRVDNVKWREKKTKKTQRKASIFSRKSLASSGLEENAWKALYPQRISRILPSSCNSSRSPRKSTAKREKPSPAAFPDRCIASIQCQIRHCWNFE